MSTGTNNVLVTGGSGYLGSAVVRELLRRNMSPLVLSRDPGKQVANVPTGVECVAGDIQDRHRVIEIMKRYPVSSVIHCAAHKYVQGCEDEPMRAIRTNINGMANVFDTAVELGVDRAVFISSDKACDNTVYGKTKSLGESLITWYARCYGVHYNSVRLGNLLGSTGSVVPLWQKAIRDKHPITVHRHNGIAPRRYIIHRDHAAKFVVKRLFTEQRGCIFFPHMCTVDLEVLARVLAPPEQIQFGDCDPSVIHQDIVSEAEASRVFPDGDMSVIHPTEHCSVGSALSTNDEVCMDATETKHWLSMAGLLNKGHPDE